MENLLRIRAGPANTLKETVHHTAFHSNKALGADGGAIFLEDESHLMLHNCQFVGNTAALGEEQLWLLNTAHILSLEAPLCIILLQIMVSLSCIIYHNKNLFFEVWLR